MWTAERIDQFNKDFGFKPLMTKSEVKEMPKLLNAEENLLGVVEGFLKEIHGRSIGGNGLIIVTDRRVIFYRKSMLGTVTKEETPISRISSASFRKGLMSASISITTSNNESVIEQCDKKLGEKVVETITKTMNNFPTTQVAAVAQPVAAPAPAAQEDSMAKLEKLFEMKQKGILTEEEFSQQKAKLLAS